MPPREQAQQAADARAQHLTHGWTGRDAEEPGAIPPGRGATEPYFIRAFDALPAFAAVANGSTPVTELLARRPEGAWAVDGSRYVFRQADSVTRV